MAQTLTAFEAAERFGIKIMPGMDHANKKVMPGVLALKGSEPRSRSSATS
jgi:hypothetical protein